MRVAKAVICGCVVMMACAKIDSGTVGVKKKLGVISKEELAPGLKFFIPMVQSIEVVPVYDIALHFAAEGGRRTPKPVQALSNDGLPITVELTVRYSLDPENVAELMIDYGSPLPYTVEDKLIIPTVRSSVRDVISSHSTPDIYRMRDKFNETLRARLERDFKKEPRALFKDVLLRNVKFPLRFLEAIERKQIAEQEAERMKYVLQKEELEARRKEIEARGIANAQKIIARSLTRGYLIWKDLEVRKEFAESPNTTIIIAPYDSKLVPLLPVGK